MVVQIEDDLVHEIEDLETVVLRERIGDRRNRICEPKLLKDIPVAALGESSPRLLREHAVGDEGRDALRTELLENLAALVQGAAGLHEIVDDDHALTRGVAVLNIHDSLVAIPHLSARDDFQPEMTEHVRETLGRPVIREGHAVDLVARDNRVEQRDGCLERPRHAPMHVEPVLEGVKVVNDESRRPAARWQIGEHLRVGIGRRHLALLNGSFHGPDWVKREHDHKLLDEGLQEHD
mmetsp:Transcript_10839/g.25369  ORF Transcript_10839/g.25369 Transcript_10839/m.25369 type:complete len:236 (-) Transcript_10839:691-1398(-)